MTGTIEFLMPKKHGYRHQHRDPSCATAHFLAKYVISYIFMTAILKWCHKTRLRGGGKFETIKSIWATEMAKMTYTV